MDNKKNNKWILIIIVAIAIFLFKGTSETVIKEAMFETSTVVRTISGSSASATISPNTQFNVIYAVSETPDWGVSVIESVSGLGCTPTGTSKFVITSSSGTKPKPDEACTSPCTKTYTTGSSGTCTFSGTLGTADYQFGTWPLKAFSSSLTVSVGISTCPIVGDTYPACNGINIGELGILAQAWINAGGPEGTLLNNLAIGAQDWINNGGPE